jgi:hypothetical protein
MIRIQLLQAEADRLEDLFQVTDDRKLRDRLRLFNDFLDRFAPGAIEGRRVLYNVRSGLSHGSMPPFLVDTELHFGFVLEDHQQRQLAWDALGAARIAMHNWLRDPCLCAGRPAPANGPRP